MDLLDRALGMLSAWLWVVPTVSLTRDEILYANAYAEGFSAGSSAALRGPRTCPIRVIDPGPAFNLNIIKRGAKVKWAENNVERASRHFQYGSEWWIHRRLASLPSAKSTNTSLVSKLV